METEEEMAKDDSLSLTCLLTPLVKDWKVIYYLFLFLEQQVETSGQSLFFALRKSASDIVTMGLIRSSRDGADTPEIVIPGDQESVVEKFFLRYFET